MKSLFFLDPNDSHQSCYDMSHWHSHTTRENPFTHPEAFQPHFHEFHIYTGPGSSDDLEEDGDSDLVNHHTILDSDHDDLCSDLPVDSSDPDESSNPFPGKDQLAPTIANSTEALEDLKKILNPP